MHYALQKIIVGFTGKFCKFRREKAVKQIYGLKLHILRENLVNQTLRGNYTVLTFIFDGEMLATQFFSHTFASFFFTVD